ncbi:zinc-binding dehydrogenase [Gordonia insulae]|uniref:2-haloacrylate reductase n=1 Tax=Gordonia insulae TaxID=2420509 RepID=A0A3G8JLS8_9ACTN|nr:zinc-binding dehydrogenase [Gordonia insulae]AZG46031.1 2-haloacrylate reductase [Gordonia insulae]
MTMRALIGGLGSDWKMTDTDLPALRLGAVRVRVVAAAMNRADLYMLEGTYSPNAKTSDVYTAGMEFAGIVETSSPMAPHLPVGTRVMGVTLGAFADYALCHPGTLLPIPDDLSFSDAATLPVGLATEHDALVTQAGFSAGGTVMIVGGTTAIGLVGIQLAKALGAATVIATTTSESKRVALVEAGADVTVNTSTEDLAEVTLAATAGSGVDITLDHVGGDLFAQLPAATAVGGTIVSIGRLAGPVAALDLDQVAFRRQRVIGTTFSVRTPDELAEVCAALQPEVIDAVADGRITPRRDRSFPPEDHLTAANRLRGNEALGKIVFGFAPDDHQPQPVERAAASFFGTISQLGYVVTDLDAAIAHWISLGVGPWFRTRNVRPENFTYHGQPSDMVMDVALANSGELQIELIQQTNDAPSMYRDFLATGSEGLQHVAYWSSEYQDLHERAIAAGFVVGQQGELGGPEGRFCYFDTEDQRGTVVEISDVGGPKALLFGYVKLAAQQWDGTNPIIDVDLEALRSQV